MRRIYLFLLMLIVGIGSTWADETVKLYQGSTAITSANVASGYYVIKSKNSSYSATPYLVVNGTALNLAASPDLNGTNVGLWKIAFVSANTDTDTKAAKYYILNVSNSGYITQGTTVPTSTTDNHTYWITQTSTSGVYEMGLSSQYTSLNTAAIGATSTTVFNRTSTDRATEFELIPVTPFETPSSVSAATKWYHIKGKKNNYIKYQHTSGSALNCDASSVGNGAASLWCFVPNSDGSYNIYSKLDQTKVWGAFLSSASSSASTIKLTTAGDESASATSFFILPTYADYPYMGFRINTSLSETEYINQYSNSNLGNWNDGQAIYGWGSNVNSKITGNGDDGSGFYITEAADMDYATLFDATDNSSRYDRYLKGATVSVNSGTATEITCDYSTSAVSPLYYDKTTTKITVKPGDKVKFTASYSGNWMHAYSYVDWNNDKQFKAVLTGSGPYTSGTGNELVAYSCYNSDASDMANQGWTDAGTNVTGNSRNTLTMSEFTVPEDQAEGDYRARVKVDWNCIAPEGQYATYTDGGGYVDFILTVEHPTINITLTEKTLNTTYTGTYRAIWDGDDTTEPVFTGANGLSLSNKKFTKDDTSGELSFTADVTFPVAVSSASTVNKTYISTFRSADTRPEGAFLWKGYSDDTESYVSVLLNATASYDNQSYYTWAIYPKLTGTAFSFNIKNVGTGTYITTTSTASSHDKGVVTLTGTGTDLTYDENSQWKIPTGTNLYLSINSSSSTTEQYLGTYTSHAGTKVTFPTYHELKEITCNFKKGGSTWHTETVSGYIGANKSDIVTLPSGVEASDLTGTITAEDITNGFDVTCSFATDYPFEYSSAYGQTAKWYTLSVRPGTVHYPKYDTTSNEIERGTTEPTTLTMNDIFAFVGDPWGMKIVNGRLGEGNAFGGDIVNKTQLKGVTTANAKDFLLKIYGTGDDQYFTLIARDNTSAYVHDFDGGLGYWTESAATTDLGSKFTFTAVDEDVVEALFGSDVTNTYVYTDGTNELYRYTYIDTKGSAPAGALTLNGYTTLSSTTAPETIASDATAATYTYTVSISGVPFTASTSYDGATWYLFKNNYHSRYVNYDAEKTYLPMSSSYDKVQDMYLWAFIGNAVKGYKLINKAAGSTLNAYIETASNGAIPTMQTTEQYWPIVKGNSETTFSFELNGVYTNDYNGDHKLSFWQQGPSDDNGSNWVVEDAKIAAASLITAVQGQTKVELVSGATLYQPGSTEVCELSTLNNDITTIDAIDTSSKTLAELQTLLASDSYTHLKQYKNSVASYGALKSVILEPKATVKLNGAETSIVTFTCPTNCTKPDDISIWDVTVIDGVAKMTTSTDNYFKGHKPYIVTGSGKYQLVGWTYGSYLGDGTNGNLRGSSDGNDIDMSTLASSNGTPYVLYKRTSDGSVYFRQSNKYGTLAADKAYLWIPEEDGARQYITMSFDDGIATGIVEFIGNDEENNAEIFDLNGRRVNEATKGIYIINGKKVIK